MHNMKVTVCFGQIRIVVPCGNGQLLVKDLINEATRRYKKATGKEPESWVAVYHLQTQSGILDPDDCLRDVVDDREQILASFEDSGPDPGVQQGGGDGASGTSSIGTGSPDIFRDPTNTEANIGITDASTPHIEVTSTTSGGSHIGLQVRRSSDPNLALTLQNELSTNKRWSAAAPASGSTDMTERILDKVAHLAPPVEEEDETHHAYGSNQLHPQQLHQPFSRSGRLSMQFLGNEATGYKFLDAAEKYQLQHNHHHSNSQPATTSYSSKSLPRDTTSTTTAKRKEPLGQAYESIREGEMILIINEYGSPLGLTAIPDRERGGLLVQQVEAGSRAERGRLRKGDRILEINGVKLVGLPEGHVQDHLRRSLASTELRIRVIRANKMNSKKHLRHDPNASEMIESGEKTTDVTKVATISPTKKIPGAQVGTSLQVANTRKLGRKIEIILKKGPHGLGFSVTTRDNPAGGHCPIYIKNILPRGAAIEDGRLKPGDRLLDVDDHSMTGKSQSDVVAILRATQPGASVKIIVSRQQELTEESKAEKELEINTISTAQSRNKFENDIAQHPALINTSRSMDKLNHSLRQTHRTKMLNNNVPNDQHFIDAGSESAASTDSIQGGAAWRNREVVTLHIPVHDTEKAGLGVSVKGKTISNNSSNSSNSMKHDGDLGIFVKNVIHGGAASRDGRLRMNDQLISVNGVSLLGQNNAEAMETLRRAMLHIPAKRPGIITLTVARKITRSHSSGEIKLSENQQKQKEHHDSSNTSENSGTTVIYLTPDKKDPQKDTNRWSNPVLDRLTGGVCSTSTPTQNKTRPQDLLMNHGLRNESYYIATNDTSALTEYHQQQMNARNNSVLIEDDAEPLSPMLPHRPSDWTQSSSVLSNTGTSDATYSSQLSLDTNNSNQQIFSRDQPGRRSISEKHHAALDARETGTYQRNKKLREERERERRIQLTKSAYLSGSIESLARIAGNAMNKQRAQQDLTVEALDQIGDLGPSLGLKKSSSLESLQTMVQEIQKSDDIRGAPSTLKAPRGKGREDILRAAVHAETDSSKPRKHWLLEDNMDIENNFNSQRKGPLQSSLNEGKIKDRHKKPSILRGIGSMFRFGKHRKDGIVPAEPTTVSEFGNNSQSVVMPSSNINGLPPPLPLANNSMRQPNGQVDQRYKNGPPVYQPPPPPFNKKSNGITQNDIFNHRYQHYINYEELQQNISQPKDELSESTLESMRLQVMVQRNKVEQESRRHQHYHSQRSARSHDLNPVYHQNHPSQQHQIQQPQIGGRPFSSYYEYETVQHNLLPNTILSSSGRSKLTSPPRTGINNPSGQSKQWKSATLNCNNSISNLPSGNINHSGRARGPFVTQVTIKDQGNIVTQHQQQQAIYGTKLSAQQQQQQQPHASKV